MPEEEDQVRRQDAQMLPLYQLQDRMHLHSGGEEAESAKGVRFRSMTLCFPRARAKTIHRAKYIEGLENRLGRMESLLKLSGLLTDDDGGKTDLGTLEKRLADRSMATSATATSSKASNRSSPATQSIHLPGSQNTTPRLDVHSSPRDSIVSPASQRENEEEVEQLSDMMCSLVTNNCGETRYIGTSQN